MGYGTEKDLKRHLMKSHPTDGNAHWTFPLPKRQKKLDIFSAIKAGDLESVRRCVEELRIDANNGRGRRERKAGEMTPLCLATIHNQVEIVKYLLGKGVDVMIPVKRQGLERLDTALEIAVTLSRTLIAELLLENGAPIGLTNAGETILNEALKIGSWPMVQLLVSRGASELGSDLDLVTAMRQAARKGDTDILKVLLEADTGGNGIAYESVLLAAVSDGQIDAARLLLDNGVSFAAFGALHSILPRYSEDLSKETLELFSQYGIFKGREKEVATALQRAAAEGVLEITRALLELGIGIDKTDEEGQTALHLACQGIPQVPQIAFSAPAKCNYYAVVRLLLEKGANAEARNFFGQTPLQLAVQHNVGITEVLLDFGVELNVRDNMGNTALSYANMVNDQEIADILRDHGGII